MGLLLGSRDWNQSSFSKMYFSSTFRGGHSGFASWSAVEKSRQKEIMDALNVELTAVAFVLWDVLGNSGASSYFLGIKYTKLVKNTSIKAANRMAVDRMIMVAFLNYPA
jgi:hypothetical protein